MSGDPSSKLIGLPLPEAEQVDQACDRFETAWRAGEWPCIEGYLDAVAGPGPSRTILLRELIRLEVELRREVGERPTAEEYAVRFPDQAAAIAETFGRDPPRGAARRTMGWEAPAAGAPTGEAVTSAATTIDRDPQGADDLPIVDGALGRIVGDYLILDRIGSGGMGVVYRALQRSARRIVALKVIKADWWGDSTEGTGRRSERRFHNEVEAQGQLEHDHIVPIYEIGHVDGILFFSMRLIKGRSLSQMVRSDGPLTPRRAAYYLEAIARAVQFAHSHQIVHRDLKPGNVMVDENDRPYLIDLGLARSLEATDYLTLTGRPLGTPEYMSPEQARGQSDIGFGTDVYGLGATLFTLLTGRPPFSGPNPTVTLRRVIDEEPAWPRERVRPVDPELKAICRKCLEKEPGRRFSSAGELALVLNKYLNFQPTGVYPPGPWARLVKWVRRQPWRAAAAGIALVAGIAATLLAAWIDGRNRATAEFLVRDVQAVPFGQLPPRIEQMAGYRPWVDRRLRDLLDRHPADAELRSRLGLALLPSEPARAIELSDRLLACPYEEHRVIRQALRAHWPVVAPRLRSALGEESSDPARRVRAATALIALDGPATPADRAWAGLALADVPDSRAELLDWMVRSEVPPAVLVDRLAVERDASVRRELVQALGALGKGRPPSGVPTSWLARLPALYRDDPDPGVHSSLAYLMRRWGLGSEVKRIDAELAGKPRGGRHWYVNPSGMTLAVVDVPESFRPSPPEPGQPVARFAIATTETPLALFQEFFPKHDARRREYPLLPPSAGDPPADHLSYFEAAVFCNWLSHREKIPPDQWCYVPGSTEEVWVMAPDYTARRGYRLPTIREWEYAARAGTITEQYFGQDLTHIDDYAWRRKIDGGELRPQSVGLLRPNDFGLFDVLGNVSEWCYHPGNPCSSECGGLEVEATGSCELQLQTVRGGAFYHEPHAHTVRNASEFDEAAQPWNMIVGAGFRVIKNEP